MPPPSLAPPGAGLPLPKLLLAKHLLRPLYARAHPIPSIPSLLKQQCDFFCNDFAALAQSNPTQLTQRVLIPPTLGLEDNSRFYSLAMVLHHLLLVNTRLIEIFTALSTSTPLPQGPSTITDFKPDPNITPDVAPQYHDTTHQLADTISAIPRAALSSRATIPHPWFGPLTLPQWIPFSALHQQVHTRQWRRIRARLD